MSDDTAPKLEVPEKLYVNEATLEYLTAKMEAQVQSDLFRRVGLPVGGGGLLVLIVTMLVWLPKQAKEYATAAVQSSVQSEVEAYLASPDGKQAIASSVNASMERVLPEHINLIVAARLPEAVNPKIGPVLDRELPTLVSKELKEGSGKQEIKEVISTYLKSPDGRRIVTEQLNEALGAWQDSMTHSIRVNQARHLAQFAAGQEKLTAYDDGVRNGRMFAFEKGTLFDLKDFLESDDAKDIQRNGYPVVLTLPVRRGPFYQDRAIRTHLREFRQTFGGNFAGVAMPDIRDGQLFALVDDQAFEEALGRNDGLMSLLTSGPSSSKDAIKAQLRQVFEDDLISLVPANRTVREVLLSDEIWRDDFPIGQRLAIIDADGILAGVPTRYDLVTSLISE